MKATRLDQEEDEEYKIAMLLTYMGDEGIEVYNTFTLEKPTLEAVVKKFDEHCVPRRNTTYEAYQFFQIALKEGQPFEIL